MQNKPFLSLIFPAYNEETRLPKALEQTIAFLQSQAFEGEIIVVENGSADRTYEIACSYQEQFPSLQVIQSTARGKGLAVKKGMLAATGQYRMFLDVDLSMPIEDVVKFIPPVLPGGVDIAISSREGKDAHRIGEPAYRHFMGRVFNTLIRLLILPQYQDSQCGFKCFKANVVEDLFPLQTVTGWAFDTEILYIANLRGYRVQEIGINWYFDTDSRVKVVRDTIQMVKDTFTIKRNHRQGFYSRNSLE
ncbi:MAG: dolichyl-phosphate beta-glucosyltransferase [Anaerolineae bacterium]|jgi:glycosyltransferase involved in cell wall biosynthesis|nr:dolichyl-phosphate beta-glucosyltransferase [Anaerolineae bacterium]